MRRKAAPRKKCLSQQDLRDLGVSPGFVTTRYSPDGKRATIRQLAPESDQRRKDFARRLAIDTNTGEKD
jgi:hypothetical protein